MLRRGKVVITTLIPSCHRPPPAVILIPLIAYRWRITPMTRFAWLAPCLFLLHPAVLPAASVTVEEILQQLGSRNPKARERAQRALEKLGPDSLPALRKALG